MLCYRHGITLPYTRVLGNAIASCAERMSDIPVLLKWILKSIFVHHVTGMGQEKIQQVQVGQES